MQTACWDGALSVKLSTLRLYSHLRDEERQLFKSKQQKRQSPNCQRLPAEFFPQELTRSQVHYEIACFSHRRCSPSRMRRRMRSAPTDRLGQLGDVNGRSRPAELRSLRSQRVLLPICRFHWKREFVEALHPELITLAGELRRGCEPT